MANGSRSPEARAAEVKGEGEARAKAGGRSRAGEAGPVGVDQRCQVPAGYR